jgi:nicotinate-nucleotide adenylyltransferase
VAVIGILGGVFDPPHIGHVALARAAVRELGLDLLLVTVVADPGHKIPASPVEVRLELARLAFDDVSEAMVELDPHARTVDSLEARGLDDPFFVLGADELVSFESLRAPERVLRLARLAVAVRPGVSRAQIAAVRARLGAGDRIVEFDLEPVDISSTEVRELVAAGEPVDDLVPSAVAEAIGRLGLYRGAEYTPTKREGRESD